MKKSEDDENAQFILISIIAYSLFFVGITLVEYFFNKK